MGNEAKVSKILDYLSGFENLRISGRNGMFRYTHMHDMLTSGFELVNDYVTAREG